VWAVKVFDRELSTTGAGLVGALRWARERKVHLVNLSLGTTNAEHEAALANEVAAALQAGVVIVAARSQQDRRWLPGALPGVVAVDVDMSMTRDACEVRVEKNDAVTITASGYPRPILGVPPDRNLKGVSFAVANASGLLARAWPQWPEALLRRQGK